MIHTLVQSALQTRCLSVESEGLIRQILAIQGCSDPDREDLKRLVAALKAGHIQRESAQHRSDT